MLLSGVGIVFLVVHCFVTYISSCHFSTLPYADTVIINGEVITADNDKPEQVTIAEAIAIRDSRIIDVGSNDEIQERIANWTEIIDAKGNTVIPGLIDTHNHIFETALGFDWVVTRIPEMLEISIRADSVDELTRNMERAVAASRPNS